MSYVEARPLGASARRRRILRRRFLRRPAAVASLLIVVGAILAAVFAKWVAPYPPEETDFEALLASPSREHLLGTGRRRLAALGRQLREGTASVRLRGYREALDAAGVELPAERVVRVRGFGRAEGYLGMRALLDLPAADRPDAVFSFNDLMAVGALHAAAERGRRVPADLAVIGFDDIPLAASSAPPLTTVRQPMTSIGRVALRNLFLQSVGEVPASHHIQLATKLVVRDSTAPPASKS